jgi:cob(I)alamin adenosyltransferase
MEVMRFLRDHPSVRAFGTVDELSAAMPLIQQAGVNTIFIDPICEHTESRLEDVAAFISSVRAEFPHIVFVIFTISWLRDALCEVAPRLKHYFYYDGFEHSEELSSIVDRCEEWHRSLFPYDVAISFAGDDRSTARELAAALTGVGASVFFDEYSRSDLWGKDLYDHLSDVYRQKARYCVILASRAYAAKMWTAHERRAAQERALKQRGTEYILPVRLDNTPIPGLLDTVAYVRIDDGISQIASLIAAKLWRSPDQPKDRIGSWMFERF